MTKMIENTNKPRKVSEGEFAGILYVKTNHFNEAIELITESSDTIWSIK